MTTHPETIGPDHPAIEAARRSLLHRRHPEADGVFVGTETPYGLDALEALAAALPHLTVSDLRDTPVGRALMAEALEEEAYVMDVVISNGDAAEVAAHAPGESGRGSAVGARDALYENPAQYLRNRARTYRTETPDE